MPLNLDTLADHMEATRTPEGRYVRPALLAGLLTLEEGHTAVVRPVSSSVGYGWIVTHRSASGFEILHGGGIGQELAHPWTEFES